MRCLEVNGDGQTRHRHRHERLHLRVPHEIYFLWRPHLRDAKDELILELAVKAGCQCIVTFNQRDFVGAEKFAISVLDPGTFLRNLGPTP